MKRLGILGPRGTHSEAAAVWLNAHVDEPRELVICPDIYDVLRAVEEGELDAGLVPVENSLEGSINITLDTLARSDHLTVAREVIWRVHNQLMARTGVVEVKKIISHAQPISQCRRYIRKNYPSAELETVQSTARAAEIAAASDVSDGVAAICTKRAGELNDLIALATEIQDNIFNSTRFFEVADAQSIGSTSGDKVLIICQIHGERTGALCEVLEEFAFRRVNMTRIESRPARTKLGEYIFFFDLDANVPHDVLEQSIDAVTRRSIWLKRLGAFPVLAADNV